MRARSAIWAIAFAMSLSPAEVAHAWTGTHMRKPTACEDPMQKYTWVGLGGDANWDTAANWKCGVVPDSTGLAVFDSSCASNCSPNMNVDVNVLGIKMKSTYTGTITQASGKEISVGSEGWTIASGTFAGSDADITITGATGFVQTGGTFTSTAANLSIASPHGSNGAIYRLFDQTAGTFAHNNGTVTLYPGVVNTAFDLRPNGTISFYDLIVTGGDTCNCNSLAMGLTVTGNELTVEHDFSYSVAGSAINTLSFTAGTIHVKGNISAGRRTIMKSGMIILDGTGAQTYETVSSGQFPGITVDKTAGSVSPAAGTTSATFGVFNLTQGSFTAPTGLLTTYGSLSFGASASYTHSNGTLKILGAGFTHSLALAQNLTVYDLTFGAGNFCCAYTTAFTISGGGTFLVEHDFTMNNADTGTSNLKPSLSGAVVQVKGNVTFGTGANGGTAGFLLNGTGAQNLSYTTGWTIPKGTFTINKASGTTTLTSDFSLSGAGQQMVITAGTVDMAGFALTVNGVLTNNGTITRNGGTLTYGSLAGSGTINP